MKIAVTSNGPLLDDNVEARFGRCAYFLLIDPETMQCEAIENPNIALGGGAGIQSAQLMSEKGVTVILTGNCGPNAFNVFGQAGIRVVVGVSGSVRHAIEQFKTGSLSSVSEPNVASHFGMGRGSGMGRGGGMGRGMGRGGGMGRGIGHNMGMAEPIGMLSAETNIKNVGLPLPVEELAQLKQHAQMLEQQKQQLDRRISQLEQDGRAVAVIESDKCTGCGICADVCPNGAIEINHRATINEQICTGCEICVSRCPHKAITIMFKKP